MQATSWLDSTDAALSEGVSVLQRIRELVVQASNGTYEENQRNSIAEEITQLKEHLIRYWRHTNWWEVYF